MYLTNDNIIMYTVRDIQNIFQCGSSQAYSLVNTAGFPSIRIGRKILVEKKALEIWLDKNKSKKIVL